MKIAIAEVKRRLAPGTRIKAEFLGKRLSGFQAEPTERDVVSNKSQLVMRFLHGPDAGRNTHLPWKGLTAEDVGGSIVLSDESMGGPFVKYTILGGEPR